jgi:hypothetical protein
MPPIFISIAVENFRAGRPAGLRPEAVVLHRSGGSREFWRASFNDASDFTMPFCRLDETDRYVAASYRGKSHFALFPDTQVDAVATLVRGLCERFAIRPTLPPDRLRFECDPPTFASYQGVCSHANFRTDKWDIGPAFPWERLAF